MKFICVLLCLLFMASCTREVISDDRGKVFTYSPKEITSGITLGEIYKTENFAAFTDLAFYNKKWYAVFRSGTQHIGGQNGHIKVLSSTDGIQWKVEQIFTNDSLDLRDPKLLIDTLRNQLFVHYFGATATPDETDKYKIYNFVVPFSNSLGWSTASQISNDQTKDCFAFWRLTNHKGKMYCAAFHIPILGGYTTDNLCLFVNNTDDNFKVYKAIGRLNLGNSPNETTIRFGDDDKMFFLVRTEIDNSPIGIATPPFYTTIKWIKNPLLVRLGSPNFLLYHNKLLITGRDLDKRTFKFFSYNLQTNSVEKRFTFPSGYETGYGGMSFNPQNPDELLISYYSIVSESSSIYLAKMDLKTFLQ